VNGGEGKAFQETGVSDNPLKTLDCREGGDPRQADKKTAIRFKKRGTSPARSKGMKDAASKGSKNQIAKGDTFFAVGRKVK